MKLGYTRLGEGVSIFLETGSYHFRMMLPAGDLASPSGREIVNAWLLGITTIPGLEIPHREVEALMDALDSGFPIAGRLRKPRLRLF